jgi:hypothetical protein
MTTFDEQSDKKTVVTMRQLHPTKNGATRGSLRRRRDRLHHAGQSCGASKADAVMAVPESSN